MRNVARGNIILLGHFVAAVGKQGEASTSGIVPYTVPLPAASR